MKRPKIGVTLDSEQPGGYSKFPWYALRENYCSAVAASGGLPLALPHEPEMVDHYLQEIDGLIVTGGAFDVDPALFGAQVKHSSVVTKARRTQFEWDITKGALARNIPILGICGGQQLLNVVLGGTLIQHIPEEQPSDIAHEQPNPRNEPGHKVKLEQGTRLAHICGAQDLLVNSAHHQAVKDVGPGIKINAYAEDGVIEGIEDPNRPFCIGVQWHPEFFISLGDKRLFESFIGACNR